MRLRRQLGRRVKAIVLMVLTAAAGVASAGYLLANERLASPFASSYAINAPFNNVSGIDPGIGIPVNVAGVRVGQVTDVFLRNGLGVLKLQIDPSLLPHVYADAQATLVPRTPLKDMQVDLSAGAPPSPPLRDGATLDVGQTHTPVDSDELLSALDVDTRTWVQMLIINADTGLDGRGGDLRSLLEALSPTVAQTRQIGDLLASRRVEIRRLVHNLTLLTQALASGDDDLKTVVQAGNAALGTLAAEDAPLRTSVAELPGTLASARTTLGHLTTFAGVLGPTLNALTPVAPRLPTILRDSRTLLSGGGVLPVQPVRAFTDAAQPLAALLPSTTQALTQEVPPLVRIAGVLQRTTNALAYVPGGRDQGYLYWLAWFAHNLDSVVSTQDAQGSVIRGLVLFSCSSGSQIGTAALLDRLVGLPGSCRTGP